MDGGAGRLRGASDGAESQVGEAEPYPEAVADPSGGALTREVSIFKLFLRILRFY